MANYPKKLMDPTEAALSAIQEARNVRDDEERQAAPPDDSEISPPRAEDAMARTEPAMPAFDEAIDLDDIDTRGHRAAEPQPFHAANDDQQSIGRILRALQDRPAKTSYFVAALFSAAWVVGCLALSWAYLADFNAALGPGHSPAAAMIGLGAAALLPIIFFFGIAHMAWRSQELRLITQSMAQVAMRLAEPESVARDSIVTVGQAIRREVAAMGDGVERALASLKPWCRTKSPLSSAPIATMKSASAACSKTSPTSATRWSGRPSRCARQSTTSTSID